MELPSINNKSTNRSVLGPLKFTNKFTNSNLDRSTLTSLQTDNLFFKQKLAEFEVRLDNISSCQGGLESSNKNSKFNRFNNAKLRERTSHFEENSMAFNKHNDNNNNISIKVRKPSISSQISARMNTGRSSIFTARTEESIGKIDEILNNLKK